MEMEKKAETRKRVSKAKVKLPVNLIAVGETADGDVRVYIKQDVYKETGKLPQEDRIKEKASVLVGATAEEAGRTHVMISGFIDVKKTNAADSVKFTKETLDHVEEERKKIFPKRSIVGWQNALFNQGAVLSDYAQSVHEKFFSLPNQVAYVTDPVRGERALYQWKDGKLSKLEGYYIYDDAGVPLSIIQEKKEPEKKTQFKKFAVAAVCLLLASTIGLAIALLSLSGSRNEYLAMNEEAKVLLEERITQQQAEIDAQKNTIDELQGTLVNNGDTEEVELKKQLEEQQTLLDGKESELGEMKTLLDSISKKVDGKVVYFKKYVVGKGDTLARICRGNDIKYLSNRKVILAVNGIKNENLINVGQTILLPAVVMIEE